jgi:hypothetical protein
VWTRSAALRLFDPGAAAKQAIEERRRRANHQDHCHIVANPAKGEKPRERTLANQGYRPERKTARRQHKKQKR